MSAEDFTRAMTFLGLAYDKEFTSEQVGVWYSFFYDERYEDFRRAVVRLTSRSKFMPSIAEIKEELVIIRHPEMQISANEAWGVVQSAIRNYGYYRADEAIKSLDECTAEAVRRIGGFQGICVSEDGDWKRKDFVRVYEEISKRNRTDLLYAEPNLTEIEILRASEHRRLLGVEEEGS